MRGIGERASRSDAILASLACGLVALAGLATYLLWRTPAPRPAPLVAVHEAGKAPQHPSLYCLFFDFTHASVVVGFDFVVDPPTPLPPRFAERAEAVRDDPALTFPDDRRPVWSYTIDEDGNPSITSPDGATRIMLYGLKLATGGVVWIEAGLRSTTFRNLDGKCLQSHFDTVGQSDASGPVRRRAGQADATARQ